MSVQLKPVLVDGHSVYKPDRSAGSKPEFVPVCFPSTLCGFRAVFCGFCVTVLVLFSVILQRTPEREGKRETNLH